MCPNCGGPAASLRSPYCSDSCREEAALVRQTRSALEEGAILDRDRQIALGQKLWHILGGGYPLRQSLILPRTHAQVMARADGNCAVCGAPATAIDHTGSG